MKKIIFACVISLICFTDCKKNKESTDCGCDAPTRITIPDTANLIGTISFYSGNNSQDFKNKYIITYVEQNCGNCIHYMAICNEFILPQVVVDIKTTNQTLQVKFGGDLKPICDKVFAPADYTYEHIYLSKIEVQ